MKNPDAYFVDEPDRIAPRETPSADPEYLRLLGDQWAHTWTYLERNPKRTLLEMLQPDFWRHCVERGLRRGSIVELRLGPPEELKTRRICIVSISRHTRMVTLSIENTRGDFKIVSHPDVVGETEAAA